MYKENHKGKKLKRKKVKEGYVLKKEQYKSSLYNRARCLMKYKYF
jgi:hypothetical protein